MTDTPVPPRLFRTSNVCPLAPVPEGFLGEHVELLPPRIDAWRCSSCLGICLHCSALVRDEGLLARLPSTEGLEEGSVFCSEACLVGEWLLNRVRAAEPEYLRARRQEKLAARREAFARGERTPGVR